MDEALDLIRYQRDQLKKKDEYINGLEMVATGLGSALTVCAATLFYLYIV